MIFARRSIQRMLDSLVNIIEIDKLQGIVDRLNKNDFLSLDAEWEVAVFFALAQLGHVTSEEIHDGPTKPDVTFRSTKDSPIEFIADVAAASDRGLEEQYPVNTLSETLHAKLKQLNLPGTISHEIGGAVIDLGPKKRRVELGLPRKEKIPSFIEKHVTPWLRQIKQSNALTSKHRISAQNGYPIVLTYQRNSHTSHGSHLNFTAVYSRSNNTLYNVMKRKGDQLRRSGFGGAKGVIVCDAGSSVLHERQVGAGAYSDKQIIDAFLRNNSSISFVATLYVERQGRSNHSLTGKFVKNSPAHAPLNEAMTEILCRLPANMPPPVNDGKNSAYRILEKKYGQGHTFNGGYEMSGKHFKMSSRELLALLAGERTLKEFCDAHGFSETGHNPFKSALKNSFLISQVEVQKENDRDDDWVTFYFSSDADAATAPFKIPNK